MLYFWPCCVSTLVWSFKSVTESGRLCLKPYRGSALPAESSVLSVLEYKTLWRAIPDPCHPCLLPLASHESSVPLRQHYLTSWQIWDPAFDIQFPPPGMFFASASLPGEVLLIL